MQLPKPAFISKGQKTQSSLFHEIRLIAQTLSDPAPEKNSWILFPQDSQSDPIHPQPPHDSPHHRYIHWRKRKKRNTDFRNEDDLWMKREETQLTHTQKEKKKNSELALNDQMERGGKGELNVSIVTKRTDASLARSSHVREDPYSKRKFTLM